jgi:hypothetical protein
MMTAVERYDSRIRSCELDGRDDMAQAIEAIGEAMCVATIILDMQEEDYEREHEYKPADVVAVAQMILNESHRRRTEK